MRLNVWALASLLLVMIISLNLLFSHFLFFSFLFFLSVLQVGRYGNVTVFPAALRNWPSIGGWDWLLCSSQSDPRMGEEEKEEEKGKRNQVTLS